MHFYPYVFPVSKRSVECTYKFFSPISKAFYGIKIQRNTAMSADSIPISVGNLV